MVQAQQANDTGVASTKHTHRPATLPKKMGFWQMLGMAIITLGWLLIGEITNNKRRFTL